MTVMVVEDTAILRKIMRDILIQYCDILDEDIYEAEDGVKALQQYKIVRPDLVFLDIAMPYMNGKTAIKEILDIDAKARIIMFTGSRDGRDVQECVSAGAIDYLVKPLNPNRVKVAVKNAMKVER